MVQRSTKSIEVRSGNLRLKTKQIGENASGVAVSRAGVAGEAGSGSRTGSKARAMARTACSKWMGYMWIGEDSQSS